MKPSNVAAALGIPEATLRKYATDYAEFLSPAGAGGGGRHRDFNDHDLRILKLIQEMRAANQTSHDIDVTLQSLKAGNYERLPALDENAAAIIPAPGALVAASVDNAVLQMKIEMLQEQLRGREADRDRITELEAELRAARREIALYESGRLKPPDNRS